MKCSPKRPNYQLATVEFRGFESHYLHLKELYIISRNQITVIRLLYVTFGESHIFILIILLF